MSESETGSKDKIQLGKRGYTVGEHGMEFGSVKTDPDSDTNPEMKKGQQNRCIGSFRNR